MRKVLSYVGMKLHAILGIRTYLESTYGVLESHSIGSCASLSSMLYALRRFCGGTQRDSAMPKNLLEAFLIEAHCTHPHISRV